jgi:hypothetical protein
VPETTTKLFLALSKVTCAPSAWAKLCASTYTLPFFSTVSSLAGLPLTVKE